MTTSSGLRVNRNGFIGQWLAPLALLAVAAAVAGCGSGQPAPTEAPAGKSIALVNASFAPGAGDALTGWFGLEHGSGSSYTFTADTKEAHSAPASARIHRYGQEAYGLLQQEVTIAPDLIGKTVRLSGFLKTARASGVGGALILQARTSSGAVLAHNHMDDAKLTGDKAWQKYAIDLKVPPGTWSLTVGAILEEAGTLWADDMTLEVID